MRFMFIASSSLLLAIAVGCGASSEEINVRPAPDELEMKPTLMAPAETDDVDEVDEYFGRDPILEGDERVHPVDVLEPRSDLLGTEPTDVEDIDPEHRAQPAEVGDPRLQADPIDREAVGKPGTLEPRDSP